MARLVLLTALLIHALIVSALAAPFRALVVTAHPDDEIAAAVFVYKLTTELGGVADLEVITNGEGGYKYSTLAERIYGLPLTEEAVGRANLPAIRKKELHAAAEIMGFGSVTFLDELDREYTTDLNVVLREHWDVPRVRRMLAAKLRSGRYDVVMGLLPTEGTHGAHKAATILALQAVAEMPEAERPAVLGMGGGQASEPPKPYDGLPGWPVTDVASAQPAFTVDRAQSFGHNGKLNYTIIANWAIAAHKSQGTMQLFAGQGDIERFWLFFVSSEAKVRALRGIFARMATSTPVPSLVGEAGVTRQGVTSRYPASPSAPRGTGLP